MRTHTRMASALAGGAEAARSVAAGSCLSSIIPRCPRRTQRSPHAAAQAYANGKRLTSQNRTSTKAAVAPACRYACACMRTPCWKMPQSARKQLRCVCHAESSMAREALPAADVGRRGASPAMYIYIYAQPCARRATNGHVARLQAAPALGRDAPPLGHCGGRAPASSRLFPPALRFVQRRNQFCCPSVATAHRELQQPSVPQRSNLLPRSAACRGATEPVATQHNVLQRSATCCNRPQPAATCCRLLQPVAAFAAQCRPLQQSAARCRCVMRCVACPGCEWLESVCNAVPSADNRAPPVAGV